MELGGADLQLEMVRQEDREFLRVRLSGGALARLMDAPEFCYQPSKCRHPPPQDTEDTVGLWITILCPVVAGLGWTSISLTFAPKVSQG